LINKHNAFIRVDCDVEIGGPESAIFCDTIGLGHGLYIYVSDKKISDETWASTYIYSIGPTASGPPHIFIVMFSFPYPLNNMGKLNMAQG